MRTTYTNGTEVVSNVTNILHTAHSTPNTSMSLDATDTSGNAWQFSSTHNSTLINEVFTSPRLCDSARETNALARPFDAYSRPVGYDNEGRDRLVSVTSTTLTNGAICVVNAYDYRYRRILKTVYKMQDDSPPSSPLAPPSPPMVTTTLVVRFLP